MNSSQHLPEAQVFALSDRQALVPPDIYQTLVRITEALGRRKFSKVDYLAAKYRKRYPEYAGYYDEQEALAHRLRGRPEEALRLFRAADAFFRGRSLPTVHNLLCALREAEKYDEALSVVQRALRDFPDDPVLAREGAEVFFQQGRVRDALRVVRAACNERASYEFWLLRGRYAFELGAYEEARKAFRFCEEHFPEAYTPWCNDIFYSHYMPDQSADDIRELLLRWYGAVCAPLLPTKPEALRRPLLPDKRLRIGIVSSGLTVHPVGWMSAQALRMLSRLPGYELFFYSVPEKPQPRSFLTDVFRAAASKWIEAGKWPEGRIYRRMLDDRLDIAIDMCGHGEGCMLPVFARRVAPIQVRWVGGLINTTGVSAMDYLISDRYETPEGCDAEYVEKLVRMPHSYIAYRPPEYGEETEPALRPHDSPVCFGCFNSAYKINPEIAAVWAGILRRVPGSTLYLKAFNLKNDDVRQRLRDMFLALDIEPERIRCEGHSPQDELLRCYNDVDIALDPWPYSGGLTTLEAVWKGVPVITVPGPTFAGRHAASHLHNMGLHDLVTDSFDAYADLAIKLAENRDLLDQLRYLLPYSLLTSPIVRHEQLAADLDTAFRAMWKRHCEGLPPVAMRFEQPSVIPEALKNYQSPKQQ